MNTFSFLVLLIVSFCLKNRYASVNCIKTKLKKNGELVHVDVTEQNKVFICPNQFFFFFLVWGLVLLCQKTRLGTWSF